MNKPLLHTQVRDHFEIALPPYVVAERLQRLTPPDMVITLGNLDDDDIPFEITRTIGGQTEIHMEGVLQRWQGTDTHIRLRGEVDVPAPSQALQHMLVLSVILVMSIVYWRVIGVNRLTMSVTDGGITSGYAALGVGGLWLAAVILTGWLAYWLIVRDTASGRRWQVQQEMNTLLMQIRALKDETSAAMDDAQADDDAQNTSTEAELIRMRDLMSGTLLDADTHNKQG